MSDGTNGTNGTNGKAPRDPYWDSDEAFGRRQADSGGLDGIWIEGDDGQFVSARDHLAAQKEKGDGK